MAGGYLFGYPSLFNGGKSQVNLNFIQTGGDYPFLNHIKTGQQWSFTDNTNAPVTPDLLNSDGYPLATVHPGTPGIYTIFYVPTQLSRPGNYVIKWDGNGTISCGMANTLVSGSKTTATGSGRYVFSTTDFRFVVGISIVGSPIISNLRCCHVDDETLLDAGKVFGTQFKQRLAEARFGVIRFLNWQGDSRGGGNVTNATTWATRKPTTYVFYDGFEARNSIYAGTTTNSGNAYSVAAPASWSGLVDKAMVTIVFNANATQSGTCSLNVGGTGDINILNEASGALSVGTNSYPLAGTFQSMATLIYDADMNAWIKQGGDLAAGSMGITTGVPPELMLQLCIEVGAHPYFVAPPLACTPMTDWFTQLATYCKANAPAWMVPRFEGCNELWNNSAGFFQTGYANAKGAAYGWGATDFMNWYGRAISTIGQAVNAVYGGTPSSQTKYQVLCGVQTSTGTTSGGTASSNARLASTKYLAQTPQSGYTASAASGWVTHVCNAQYIQPSDYGTANETTDAAAYLGATFAGSISGSVLSVTSVISGSNNLQVGSTIFGIGVATVTMIASLSTGAGGVGTYNLNNSQTVAAQSPMTAGVDLTAPNTYCDSLNSGSGAFNLTNVAILYSNWKTWAQGFGVQKMCGYEGGYSPNLTSGGSSSIDMLRVRSELSPNLQTYLTATYNSFVGLTGGGFTAEFPSCFQLSGNPNINGKVGNIWSVLNDVYQAPNPPQWISIVAFNA